MNTFAATPFRTFDDIREEIVAYITDNILLGEVVDLLRVPSLLGEGIIDSTGAMEIVSYLENTFAIAIADAEIVPDNLDSIDKICAFVARKQARPTIE